MKRGRRWLVVLGGLLVVGAIAGPILFVLSRGERAARRDDPWARVATRLPHTDHSSLMKGLFVDGPAVTRACLECHPKAAAEVMRTAHWKWEGDPLMVPGRAKPVRFGKKTLINNFCISVQSNWQGCTSCHAGYGWVDDSFDFSQSDHVDCLVCHDLSGTYVKTTGGLPAEDVDLAVAARSVGRPTRESCGGCHFKGGGGDAVKHGDLDSSLIHPRDRVDVHMGRHDMICTDCHRTQAHVIQGRSVSVSMDNTHRVTCLDCHAQKPHADQRLNAHVAAVACQTCHIPEVALREATKVHWDWSAAGQDLPEDTHEYLKKKGRFVYERKLTPEYYWFDGTVDRYLLGDEIRETPPTPLNPPRGTIGAPRARIWPFKVHRAVQIYDTVYRYLLVPKTVGAGGYWTDFDWDEAARLGSKAAGIEYSGQYDFTDTEMFWPLTHMVAPKEQALECQACHGDQGLLDWRALGYPGDPIRWGGRAALGLVAAEPARGDD